MRAPYSFLLIMLILLVCATTIILCSMLFGSIALSAQDVWHVLSTQRPSINHSLLLELRLPRALSAFALGGILALSGVLMQSLLRNPLADPFIMGASGGAAVAALSAMLLGLSSVAIHVSSASGALFAIVLVFVLARNADHWTPVRLLLTGVVVAAGANAIVSLLLSLGEATQVRGMLFWLMGDLSFAPQPAPLWILLLLATILTWFTARHLNVLAQGELQALALGLPVTHFRIALFLSSSVLTAASVTAVGTIGFIGLISPHMARILAGADHRRLIPIAVLLGGCLLALADLAARTILAPRQLPVGALTALVGVPTFLALMRKANARATVL